MDPKITFTPEELDLIKKTCIYLSKVRSQSLNKGNCT